MRVIYVDVLFAVNFFITFFLLIVTEKFSKRNGKIWRLVLASFIGGAYSLVILADGLSFAVSFLGKLAAACLIVLTAFKYIGIKVFIKETAIFFFVNFGRFMACFQAGGHCNQQFHRVFQRFRKGAFDNRFGGLSYIGADNKDI